MRRGFKRGLSHWRRRIDEQLSNARRATSFHLSLSGALKPGGPFEVDGEGSLGEFVDVATGRTLPEFSLRGSQTMIPILLGCQELRATTIHAVESHCQYIILNHRVQ